MELENKTLVAIDVAEQVEQKMKMQLLLILKWLLFHWQIKITQLILCM